MKIINVEQGSLEWLETRHAKIGGTRAGQVKVDSDTLPIELAAEITEGFVEDEDAFVSKDMLRGSELEPLARRKASEYIGVDFKEFGWLQSDDNELLGISPDGLSEDHTQAIEIKCPGAKKHITTCLSGVIPKDNIEQCIHYFTVNPKLQKLHFISFRPESPKELKVIELTLDSEYDFGTARKSNMRKISDVVKERLSQADKVKARTEEIVKLLNF